MIYFTNARLFKYSKSINHINRLIQIAHMIVSTEEKNNRKIIENHGVLQCRSKKLIQQGHRLQYKDTKINCVSMY